MKKSITLIFLLFVLASCYRTRRIKVIVNDSDSGLPISGIQVIITDIEHHSSGNSETVVYTDDSGVAVKNYSAPKKDAIRIRVIGKNGYGIVGESTFDYIDYQRNINITLTAKK